MGFSYYAHRGDMERCFMLVKLLATEQKATVKDTLRSLGKNAVNQKDYPAFNMVAKLWKEV